MSDPGCEHCDKEYPIEEMGMMGDCWICQPCIDEWRGIFNACDHRWEPHVDVMGDDGQCCTKCNGFVANENFPALFGKPAPEMMRDDR